LSGPRGCLKGDYWIRIGFGVENQPINIKRECQAHTHTRSNTHAMEVPNEKSKLIELIPVCLKMEIIAELNFRMNQIYWLAGTTTIRPEWEALPLSLSFSLADVIFGILFD